MWWWYWHRRNHRPRYLSLRSRDHIVNSGADVINFVFSVQVHSHSVVSLHKLLEFLLEAVVLVIEVGHVSI